MQIGDPIPGYYVGTPFNGYPGHRGADFPAPSGTPILAAHDGVVRMAGWYGGDFQAGGNLVYLTAHDGSYETSYQHMVSAPIVGVGQSVAAGQVIGYVGSTGYSSGPHLHFELWLGGKAWEGGAAVDPIPYIQETPTPPPPPEEEEDHMYKPTVHYRTEGPLEATLAHPEIGKDLEQYTGAGTGTKRVSDDNKVTTYKGFQVSADNDVIKAWSRMHAKGMGNVTSQTNRTDYIAIQVEASRIASELK